MFARQLAGFIKNKDTSTISYRPFNLDIMDKYPTFSLCFKGPDIYWHKEAFLFEKAGVTSAQYVSTLSGKGTRYKLNEISKLYLKESIGMDNVSLVDFEDVVLNPSNLLSGVEFVAHEEQHSTHYGTGKKGAMLEILPFYIGFQSAKETCITRNSTDQLDATRDYDLLSLKSPLLHADSHFNLELRIIAHHPGQLMRSFDTPNYRSTIASYNKERLLELKLTHVSTLRKRPSSEVRCNETLFDDDIKLQQEIVKHVGCIPPYWKQFFADHQGLELCSSNEQLQNVFRALENYKQYFSRYDPPCTDMTILVQINKDFEQLDDQFQILVTYTEDFYQEIENFQGFTFESFFSGVGGFVGVFLGFSMMQIPDMLSGIPSVLRKMKGLCMSISELSSDLYSINQQNKDMSK